MKLDIMRQQLILHMTNPELEISTSVSSLLLRIQRVELDVTFHDKLHFMEHFCVAILLLEPQANYVLWPHISHINEPDIYILSHIYANSKG